MSKYKHNREEIVKHLNNLWTMYEELSEQLPKSDHYGRGLFHGYSDAVKHTVELLGRRK